MPLLYGEGKKAFFRLQEEIIKQNSDLNIFAWTDSFPSMFSGLLAESPEFFRDGHDLQAVANINTVYREFSVTHQGIRFQFPLKYHDQTGCLVLPLGHQSKSQQYPLGVFLRQISYDFCVRASPDILADEDLCHRAEETTIQVPKVLSNKEILDVHQTGITFPEEFDRLRSRGPLIGELVPLGCWGLDTSTIHAGHKSIFECLLVFEMDQRCRVWNQQMGPLWTSFGVIFKYEARQEYNRRWLYKAVDTDNSIFFEKDARYMLKQFRDHGDYTNGLE